MPQEQGSFVTSSTGISFHFCHCFTCKSSTDLSSNSSLLILVSLSFLDRTNIGNAKLFSLQKDLGMSEVWPKSIQYNTALALFFPFYVAAEIPSNMMMKRMRPSQWLTIIMLYVPSIPDCQYIPNIIHSGWSICTICLGLVKNYTGLLIVRAVLGVCEGGLFPGVTYYITMW
jgi:MFS family permease